ncbi:MULTISPECIES: NblA/ycf18 family protein [unclassified Microcoleus]|uniref:NblA/ycf18 family protein n=1 Tax=unclassified Microcoleus TaxID=2642155 RepID=UPI002FD5C3DA
MTNERIEEDESQSNKLSTELTVEQQFELKVYSDKTQSLSAEEAQILLIEMVRRNMIKDNVIKHLINHHDGDNHHF